jgi:hypothetical protein
VNTSALIEQARSVGIELRLVDGKVRAIGTHEAVKRLIEPLRQHKVELTRWLTQRANDGQRGEPVTSQRLSQDDRNLCLVCSHLGGSTGCWHCSNWRQAAIALRANHNALPNDFVHLLQRCDGFQAVPSQPNL